VAGALEVLKHKGVTQVVVEELGRPAALVRKDDLVNAGPADLVSRWAQKSSGQVEPEDPAIHALAVMNARATDWLAVVSGALFMGIVTRPAIERLLHGDPLTG
jgi:CBS domain-containing protein